MFPINQVLQDDCTRVLRTLPTEVVDLVVTDPPYGVMCVQSDLVVRLIAKRSGGLRDCA